MKKMAYRQKNKNTSEWYQKKKKEILNTKGDTLSEETNKVTAIQK